MALNQTKERTFLKSNGEMGTLIMAKDWSSTPIGSPATWPISLRTTVSILLNSQFPMFIWWGAAYTTIYNDAYRVILGEKHPNALGESGPKVWEEIWDVVGPLARQVRENGASTFAEDQLLYINRHGYVEESYFTFSYSPVMDDEEKVCGVFCACTETTAKVLATRKLVESEQVLRNMILQAPAAMCILRGGNFIIEVANEKMFELWGIDAKGAFGKPLFDAVPEARNEGFEELLTKVLTTGEPEVGHDRPVSLPRNGRVETVYIDFIYKAVREVDNSISGIMAMAIDVTQQELARRQIEKEVAERTQELARANEALTRSNQELSRSNASLEEFAHAASHDMKEPIRKVLNFSGRLKKSLESRMTDSEKQLFSRVENSTQRMSLLVDDLLDFSHISQRPLVKEDVDLNHKMTLVLSDLELLVDEKGALVKVENLPVVKGYSRQLQQLLQNLVSNSLKYSNTNIPPEITVRSKVVTGKEVAAHILPGQADKQFNLLEVIDNGIGFEPRFAERIFGMFQRLHGKTEYPGTGVGLSIARKVVDNHQGVIWAVSEEGKGATFSVLLPIENFIP